MKLEKLIGLKTKAMDYLNEKVRKYKVRKYREYLNELRQRDDYITRLRRAEM